MRRQAPRIQGRKLLSVAPVGKVTAFLQAREWVVDARGLFLRAWDLVSGSFFRRPKMRRAARAALRPLL
jgi:hypothetical protein